MSLHDLSARAWQMLRGFEPASLCDWPGKVSAVLFFSGCNLRCPTCHNAAIAWEKTPSGHELEVAPVLLAIRQRKAWLDGIVLTGGEVTFLPDPENLVQDLLPLGLDLKIDTNGQKPELVKRLAEHDAVRSIAVDIKGPFEKYPALCGGRVSQDEARDRMLSIFKTAVRHPEKFMFRCTRVPGITEKDLDIVRGYLPEGFELKVQKYISSAGPKQDFGFAASA
ncbi:MAG: anaerobic ribonucleoside-triphosphate reductase activating protein [Desulfonatronovibrionaceae bacterium]